MARDAAAKPEASSSQDALLARGRSWLCSVLVVALLFTSVAVFVGSTAPEARAAPQPLRNLRIGVPTLALSNLHNPLVAPRPDDQIFTFNIYSTLTTLDASLQVQPDLASSWSLATDNRTWTFHLVPNAYFIDPLNPSSLAHPVTADDVVFTYNLVHNQTGSSWYPYAQAFASVVKVDAYTVRVTTSIPFGGAMLHSTSNIPILPQYIWSAYSTPTTQLISDPVGSGPYEYDAGNTSQYTLALRKNPAFYGAADYCRVARPDEITISSAGSPQGAAAGLGTSFDAVERLDAPTYTTFPFSSNVTRQAADLGTVGEFSINVMTPQIRAEFPQFASGSNNPLLLNATVRRAIAMSINKSALLQDGLSDLGVVADTLVPDTNPAHAAIPSGSLFPFAPASARALLNQAGWTYNATGILAPGATPLYQVGGTNPLTFRFYIPGGGSPWVPAANDVAASLAQAGIQTTSATGGTNPPYSSTIPSSAWFSGNYDLWLWQWAFTPRSDPLQDILFLETTMAIGGSSDNFYSNTTYDALYNATLGQANASLRAAGLARLQTMVYDYASYILPWYQDSLGATMTPSAPRSSSDPGWTDWGNWTEEVGLVPDSATPNLWYQVAPLDDRPPAILGFPSVQWVTGSPVLLSVNADDPEGQALTYSWSFGDGSYANGTASASVFHTYAAAGAYPVRVTVSDGAWPVCAEATASIVANTGQNLPPQGSLSYHLSGTTAGYVQVPITFNVTVSDPEGEPVSIRWSFGDGTVASNYVPVTSNPVTVTQTHTYAAVGSYALAVTLTDNRTGFGNHSPSLNATIPIVPAPDTTPPFASLVLNGTLGSGGVYTSAVTVTIRATDNGSGVAGIWYRVDNGTWTSYKAPFSLGNGTHHVDYYATDHAGNTEPVQHATVVVEISTSPSGRSGPSGGLAADAWFWALVGGLAVLAAVAVGVVLLRRRRQAPPGPPPAPPSPP